MFYTNTYIFYIIRAHCKCNCHENYKIFLTNIDLLYLSIVKTGMYNSKNESKKSLSKSIMNMVFQKSIVPIYVHWMPVLAIWKINFRKSRCFFFSFCVNFFSYKFTHESHLSVFILMVIIYYFDMFFILRGLLKSMLLISVFAPIAFTFRFMKKNTQQV